MSADRVTELAHRTFGVELPVRRWTTVHGDLHWGNLLAPDLGILDWEMWGRGPAFFDAAYLYCHSLAVPEIAERVLREFGDVLNTADGAVAQLVAISRMLRRVAGGDYKYLKGLLRDRADSLLSHRRDGD
jgi:thiamine kinase-like enzyme